MPSTALRGGHSLLSPLPLFFFLIVKASENTRGLHHHEWAFFWSSFPLSPTHLCRLIHKGWSPDFVHRVHKPPPLFFGSRAPVKCPRNSGRTGKIGTTPPFLSFFRLEALGKEEIKNRSCRPPTLPPSLLRALNRYVRGTRDTRARLVQPSSLHPFSPSQS